MAIFQNKLWLWGQSPDSHYLEDNTYNLPAHSRMSAVEGCHYFGIPNICRVRMKGHPVPPYDQESIAMRSCREVVWSLLGAGGEPIIDDWTDTDEVIRQANLYPNITGGIFDDFFGPKRIAYYTPAKLREMKARIRAGCPRPLDLWVVCYEHNLDDIPNIADYLAEFDVITYWTWRGCELGRIEENLNRIQQMVPGKRTLAGMYMWNYGERCPLTIEQMEYQASLYLRLIREGTLDGIVICSNCIADLGIEAVEWTRNWIDAHRDDVILR